MQTLAVMVPPASPYNNADPSLNAAFTMSIMDWNASKDAVQIYSEEDLVIS
jgi:hypothetical protein